MGLVGTQVLKIVLRWTYCSFEFGSVVSGAGGRKGVSAHARREGTLKRLRADDGGVLLLDLEL